VFVQAALSNQAVQGGHPPNAAGKSDVGLAQ
jgi:hypothetical protein